VRFEKVLVTGGSGLLGRFVVDELSDRCDVTVLDIAPPAREVAYRQADILDLTSVSVALAGHRAVVHLAGIDDGNDFPDQDYFRTNVQGTWNLLHAAENAGVGKVVVASSTAVYGVGRDRAPDYLPVDEAHPQRPTATYSLTKQVIEVLCRSFVARGSMSITCLRPTLIVRPEREAAILAQLELDDPEAEPATDATGDGQQAPYGALSLLRGYVRSEDAARCFRLALDYDGAPFDAFNVAAVDGIGHESLLARLERAWGRLPDIRDPVRYESNPRASVFDSNRARDRLGWQPRGDWKSIVGGHRATNQGESRQ
jgi:nucleoside-diphosphate-sugar epimerase